MFHVNILMALEALLSDWGGASGRRQPDQYRFQATFLNDLYFSFSVELQLKSSIRPCCQRFSCQVQFKVKPCY